MAANGVCLTYSWPSTGKFVTYRRDVRYAREATGHLANLIERLAASTSARRINLFAYSAGAQMAAPALALLRDRHPDESAAELRQRYRIGTVYFASPDISTRQFFAECLPVFSQFVERTTFTYNRRDRFLKASHLILLEPRAGRPTRGGSSTEEIAWLRMATSNPSIDAIDLDYSSGQQPADYRSHGAWYRHPWVSSDLFLLLQNGAPASCRGLERKPDGTGWYFPKDYPERLEKLAHGVLAPAAT